MKNEKAKKLNGKQTIIMIKSICKNP